MVHSECKELIECFRGIKLRSVPLAREHVEHKEQVVQFISGLRKLAHLTQVRCKGKRMHRRIEEIWLLVLGWWVGEQPINEEVCEV